MFCRSPCRVGFLLIIVSGGASSYCSIYDESLLLPGSGGVSGAAGGAAGTAMDGSAGMGGSAGAATGHRLPRPHHGQFVFVRAPGLRLDAL